MEVSQLNKVVRKIGLADEKSVHVVGGQESRKHDDVGRSREMVIGWVVRGHVYNRIDIGLKRRNSESAEREGGRTTYEGNSGKIPEDKQEAPLFMVYIPGLGDAFLALAAETRSTRS